MLTRNQCNYTIVSINLIQNPTGASIYVAPPAHICGIVGDALSSYSLASKLPTGLKII